MRRTEAARRRAGFSQDEIAAALSEHTGRFISADTYRKREKTALLPHDVLIAFCDITRADLFELLSGRPFSLGDRGPAGSRRNAN